VRTIKLFAVIGLAVALIAVPALAQGQQQPTTINVRCSAATPSKPEVDNRSVTLNQGQQVQWVFAANLNTCMQNQNLASAKITLTIPAGQTSPLNNPQGQPTSTFTINITPGQPATAGPYPVNRNATLGAGGISYTIEFFSQQNAQGPAIQGATIVVTPTLTEWGLIALAVLLAGSLAFMIRRRLAPRPAGA
jgi:hypothetical protein